MCGRVTLLSFDELLSVAQDFDAQIPPDIQTELPTICEAHQARPGNSLPAFVATDGLDLRPFTWGYTLPNSGKLVYNSRIESAASPLWADSFAQGRAIVPVASFFEPHRSETQRNPETGRTGKRPYEFRSPDARPLLLGAVTNAGRISIVTTEPNASVAPVHPRMPLVLSFEEVSAWLGDAWGSLADRTHLPLTAAPEHPDVQGFEQMSLF